jgi:hypothetical protein
MKKLVFSGLVPLMVAVLREATPFAGSTFQCRANTAAESAGTTRFGVPHFVQKGTSIFLSLVLP